VRFTTAAYLSGLEDHLGYRLRHVSGHVSGAFARALQARGVSVAEWVALRQVMLTPAGKQVLPELAQIADANDARFFDSLTFDEQRTLKSLLQKLAQAHKWHLHLETETHALHPACICC
jgi:hypothetical protein